MNTTGTIDEVQKAHSGESPGAQLAQMREKKGYSQEYVAGKLHLRVKIIELLELDNYQQMPEPVFIKGYLRAYANLLGISPDPLLTAYNRIPRQEKKFEKALWQSRKESHQSELLMRWITGLVALGLVIIVGIWWQKNKTSQQNTDLSQTVNGTLLSKKMDLRITDLSKMQPSTSATRDKSSEAVTSENHGN